MATNPTRLITDAILARCDAQPECVSQIFVGADGHTTSVTAGALADRFVAQGNALRERGLGVGDVLILTLDHGPDLVTLFLGAIYAGVIPCIFPSLTPKLDRAAYRRRLASAVDRVAPVAIVGQGTTIADAADLQVEVLDAASLTDQALDRRRQAASRDHECAFIQLSSGSTARQKAVPVTHRAIMNLVAARNAGMQMTTSDVVVGWVPFYHDLGIIGDVLTPLLCGIPSVAISTFYWLTRPASLMEAIHRYRGSVCTMPNFAFMYCVTRIRDEQMQALDLSSWRVLCNAAEPIQRESFTAFRDRFSAWGFRADALVSGYGLAENTLTVSLSRLGQLPRTDWVDRKALLDGRRAVARSEADGGTPIVSCGRPLDNVTIQIRSDSGEVAPERHVGEVVIQSDCLFDGYFRDPASTLASLREGWLHTGDLGYLCDGELYVCGRKKDVIIVGGANVYAEDIERKIADVPGFRPGRIVAFGAPDRERGSEKIVVVGELAHGDVVRDPREIEREVRLLVKQEFDVSLAHVDFVPAGWVAKTTSGKLARWENRLKWIDERDDARH
jgi:acyl-CoA synthetase (AMP-forming)/AMP-acid ligase II